ESTRRTKKYTKADWQQIKSEGEDIVTRLAKAMESGLPAGSTEVTALAEDGRQHISRWFYECGHAMHVALAEMYLVDRRFRSYYDDRRDGLAQYWHDAILANAENHES
nr:TipAS antibiotic-recognition domain-containing protein [Longispora sp. (in: high G+C Gram-positive bacteria)]